MLWFNLPRAIVCCVLTLAGGGAFAQVAAGDAAFGKFFAQVTGVGKQTVSYGSGGQLVVGQGVPQISTAGGPVLVDRAVPVLNNSGGQIATNARISLPPAVLGRIVRAGLTAVPVLSAGVALYDVAVEVGYTPSGSGAGVSLLKPGPTGTNAWDGLSSGGTGYLSLPACTFTSWTTDGYCRDTANALAVFVGGSSTWSAHTAAGWSTQAGLSGSPERRRFIRSAPSGQTVSAPVAATLQEFQDAVAARSGWPSGSRVSQAVADATALQPAEQFQAVPQVTGPATSTGTTSTTANPDGSTTTTTTTHNHTYTGPTINTTTQTITSTCTGGSCNTTETVETPKVDEQPFAMPCGVPGTPPCAVAVDETGMPTADSLETDGPKDEEEEFETWIEGIEAANPFPEISWDFELPTACGVIPTPAFEPWLAAIDVCQWQPMFHEIMTVVWMLGGLFGAISLFMRNSLAT